MGLYEEKIFPRLMNWVMQTEFFQKERLKVVPKAYGTVVEIGFGSGLNLPYYSKEVTRLYAVDPSDLGKNLASKRVQDVGFPVEFVNLHGNRIDLQDSVADTVLTTWTLCTVPEPEETLKEVARILKPEGQFLFLEHGLSSDPSVARWQHFFTPMQKKIACGCHLNRNMKALIMSSELNLDKVNEYYAQGPKMASYLFRGRATP